MANIRTLFHPDLPIDRPIEKVITFSNRQPDVLSAEAREYVVTKNLGSEYLKLLNHFDDAQKGDRGGAECCVWLSGFYGSGKSSFAKYFGLTFDPGATAGDGHFSELFVKQFPDTTLQARFKAMCKSFDVTVFLLDLAAMGAAGATHTPISTQLFAQVCRWAGYAVEAKIAQLEAKLDLDDRLDEFRQKAEEATGMDYDELRVLEALLIPTASQLAHDFYPNIWPSAEALQNSQIISTQTEQERVEEMLALIEKKSGSKRVLFIVDEVGHFLRNNDALINNLDGLAKNLKEMGGGKAWLIATAQETLPKTGPLFGLLDRFPIKIDLKPSDIREITHRRLLKKSADGAAALKTQYASSGQKLTLLTTLENYPTEKDLDEASFVEFYPMLPQQFDVLIDSIRSLARLQGGIGLRSAIRCVQDLLIGFRAGEDAIVDREIPALVTVADLYDILQTDIAPSSKDSVLGVDRIAHSYGNKSWEHLVAKAIALLQQIDGFPITRPNLAALLYPAVGADSVADQVDAAVATLISDKLVPIGENEGTIGFQSETVSKIDKDRDSIVVTATSRLATQSRLLREMFQKTPRVTIDGAKTVDSGISLFEGGREQKITDRDTDIRFLIQLVPEASLESTKTELVNESMATTNQSRIYIAAPRPAEVDGLLAEIHRAEEIRKLHQNDSDPEVQRYVDGQEQLKIAKSAEVQQFLSNAITKGWFIFRANPSAAATLGNDLESAMRAQLTTAAEEVFSKFKHANQNVPGNVGENFLRVSDLTQITRERDPLAIVNIQGTDTNINLSHPALAEITDFLEKHANPDGKRLLDEFARPPYGWSKDTTRYLAAALFYAQRIKIRTNGQDITVVGDTAFTAFKSNSSFNGVTILPNVSEISTEVRQRAAKRLSDLTGETLLPLPQKIAEVAVKHLPQFVKEFTNLPSRVSGLGLPTDRFKRLQNGLADALLGDGSDAPSIFGTEESELHDDLIWARQISKALGHGAEATLGEISALLSRAQGLAGQGVLTDLPADLAAAGSETLTTVENGTFYEDIPALGHTLDKLRTIVVKHCSEAVESMKQSFEDQVGSVRLSSDYQALDDGARAATDENLAQLVFSCPPDLEGLSTANATLIGLNNELQAIRTSVQKSATGGKGGGGGGATETKKDPKVKTIQVKALLKSEDDLNTVIKQLDDHRVELKGGSPIRITTV
ncbi:BREX system P-loop protein BrxC [Verrucomicrobiales bacterium]|nr:BREX system P-loop protein BrxC [Verrucomicrobiales bacterium]